MTLTDAVEGMEYVVENINTEDEELNAFLFSLGCYSGEPITVVSRKRSGLVVSIKDGRYNVDRELSSVIEVRDCQEGVDCRENADVRESSDVRENTDCRASSAVEVPA